MFPCKLPTYLERNKIVSSNDSLDSATHPLNPSSRSDSVVQCREQYQ
jgi:hypothetical protein